MEAGVIAVEVDFANCGVELENGRCSRMGGWWTSNLGMWSLTMQDGVLAIGGGLGKVECGHHAWTVEPKGQAVDFASWGVELVEL